MPRALVNHGGRELPGLLTHGFSSVSVGRGDRPGTIVPITRAGSREPPGSVDPSSGTLAGGSFFFSVAAAGNRPAWGTQ